MQVSRSLRRIRQRLGAGAVPLALRLRIVRGLPRIRRRFPVVAGALVALILLLRLVSYGGSSAIQAGDSTAGAYRLYAAQLAADSVGAALGSCPELDSFDFAKALAGPAQSLSPMLEHVDRATGRVVVNGGDTRQPTQPFTFAWGDQTESQSFFPATHTYSDTARNYTVRVIAHYRDGSIGIAEFPLWFQQPAFVPVALDPALSVRMPSVAPPLRTRLYPVPPGLVGLTDTELGIVSRSQAEYLLSVAAQLQYGYANRNVADVDGGFQQAILRDPRIVGGMSSLWFLSPPTVAVGSPFRFESSLSSLFHELGHNVTLDSPAGFIYGGKIDGAANAIYSETMAQIFQHATVYDLVRRGQQFGLSCDVREAIKASGLVSFGILKGGYESYVAQGAHYASWNDPATPVDETVGTFMTLAFKFVEHSQASGVGVELPLQRMVALLQTFNADLLAAYKPSADSTGGAEFRATLMVGALSAGFGQDLRPEFRALGFPIDNAVFSALLSR